MNVRSILKLKAIFCQLRVASKETLRPVQNLSQRPPNSTFLDFRGIRGDFIYSQRQCRSFTSEDISKQKDEGEALVVADKGETLVVADEGEALVVADEASPSTDDDSVSPIPLPSMPRRRKREKFGTYEDDIEDELEQYPELDENQHLYNPRELVEEWIGHPTLMGMIAGSEEELVHDDDPPGDGPVLHWQTRMVLVPGGKAWHPANRKVKMSVHVKELNLTRLQRERMLALVGPRYNPRKDLLTLTSERFRLREENRKDVYRTLIELITEARKAEGLVADEEENGHQKQRMIN